MDTAFAYRVFKGKVRPGEGGYWHDCVLPPDGVCFPQRDRYLRRAS